MESNMKVDMSGQRVLVVGAGGGIGLATCRAFVASEAHVVAAGRAGPRLDATRAIIPDVATLDTTDDAGIEAYFSNAGVFDHVVLTAASVTPGAVADVPLEAAYASMNSKFWGSYRVARAAQIADGGSLTFVSGFLANRPAAGNALLGAINAGLDGLARGLALERAPVRVNSVSPGLIDTPLYDRLPEAHRAGLFKATAERLPVRRIGHPDDVAAAILMIAANPYITGATLLVDGGGTIA